MFFLPLIVTLLCILFHYPPVEDYMIWNKSLILSGEWWRIVSGNFTHTNLTHLAMNLAGLWLITSIFKPTKRQQASNILLLCTSVGGLILASDIKIYLGLSGVLHGYFAYFALVEAFSGRKSSWLLVICVIGKVSWEMCFGGSVATSEMIQANVATEAHLAGLVSGLLLATMGLFLRKRAPN